MNFFTVEVFIFNSINVFALLTMDLVASAFLFKWDRRFKLTNLPGHGFIFHQTAQFSRHVKPQVQKEFKSTTCVLEGQEIEIFNGVHSLLLQYKQSNS